MRTDRRSRLRQQWRRLGEGHWPGWKRTESSKRNAWFTKAFCWNAGISFEILQVMYLPWFECLSSLFYSQLSTRNPGTPTLFFRNYLLFIFDKRTQDTWMVSSPIAFFRTRVGILSSHPQDNVSIFGAYLLFYDDHIITPCYLRGHLSVWKASRPNSCSSSVPWLTRQTKRIFHAQSIYQSYLRDCNKGAVCSSAGILYYNSTLHRRQIGLFDLLVARE